jgi:hypothetical protein
MKKYCDYDECFVQMQEHYHIDEHTIRFSKDDPQGKKMTDVERIEKLGVKIQEIILNEFDQKSTDQVICIMTLLSSLICSYIDSCAKDNELKILMIDRLNNLLKENITNKEDSE